MQRRFRTMQTGPCACNGGSARCKAVLAHATEAPHDAKLVLAHATEAPHDAKLVLAHATEAPRDAKLVLAHATEAPHDAKRVLAHATEAPHDAKLVPPHAAEPPHDAKLLPRMQRSLRRMVNPALAPARTESQHLSGALRCLCGLLFKRFTCEQEVTEATEEI
jgi:hypothetical protein